MLIEIKPIDAAGHKKQGSAHAKYGQYTKAINEFTKAIELNPKDAEAYNNRGVLYFVVLENKVKGCADWKKACKLGDCENYNRARQQGYCL